MVPGGSGARQALPCSRAVAAPAGGLGSSGKILLEGKGFSRGVLVRGAQGAAWVRGAAAQGWGSQGAGGLHAQGMLWGTVGLAPGGPPDLGRARGRVAVVASPGTRWAQKGVEGPGDGSVRLGVEGGAGSGEPGCGTGRSCGADAEEEERDRRERGEWRGGRKAGAGSRGVLGTVRAGPKRRRRKVPWEQGEVTVPPFPAALG